MAEGGANSLTDTGGAYEGAEGGAVVLYWGWILGVGAVC